MPVVPRTQTRSTSLSRRPTTSTSFWARSTLRATRRSSFTPSATPSQPASSLLKIWLGKPHFLESVGDGRSRPLASPSRFLNLPGRGARSGPVAKMTLLNSNLTCVDRNQYASLKEIRTETITVQTSNNRGDSKKAKLFITLKRSAEFFDNMKKFNEIREENEKTASKIQEDAKEQ